MKKGSRKHFICLVFEELHMNLHDLLMSKRLHNKPVGLSLGFVRIVAWQVLVALSLLSTPNINIIHCDLKPENIMLKSMGSSGIKVIDFGNACFTSNKLYKYVQSRPYRAPEVALELPYSTQVDVWSLACLLHELHFGRPLFEGLLRSIAEVIGPPPR